MHGNGNDFIIIENLTKVNALSKSQIVKIGDRNKGIGFDQLITINPPKKPNHDFYVNFFNSDGSQADMCMNGVRSVGAFLWDARLAPKKSLLLGTKSKPILIKPTNTKKVKVVFDYPIQEIIPKGETEFLKNCGLKSDQFKINIRGQEIIYKNQNFIFKNDQKNWNENFVRIKKEQSFYKSFEMKKVKDKLFQTSVFFPTNTIPGIYNVDIYYIRNNTIMSTDQKNIVIKKTGIGSLSLIHI